MAKSTTVYICSDCGYEALKWAGQCPNCLEWNTLSETSKAPAVSAGTSKKSTVAAAVKTYRLDEVDMSAEIRFDTGITELNNVLGGGIVKGSLILLGGDPGIGKSTILLQICQYLGENLSVLYVSGEESARQLKLRASRLSVDTKNLFLLSETNFDKITATILETRPGIVIIDSIQTMALSAVNSSAGSVSQIRECASICMNIAKSEEIPIILVGHVTKDGSLAGPKILEHMVDTVLYFEGDRNFSYRILRAVKNRFGSTNEIGVFEMESGGLVQVENPSATLLSGRPLGVSGSCVACVMEGSRPILAEVQALCSKSSFGNPRRTSTGFDLNRLYLILAVLEKRAGYFFGNLDVYVNVVGGLRLEEPACDLPVALALISSLIDKPVGDNLAAFGEIGLTGEIRHVPQTAHRVKEITTLGFDKIVLPKYSADGLNCTAELIIAKNIAGVRF